MASNIGLATFESFGATFYHLVSRKNYVIVTPEGIVSEVATGCVLSKKVILKTSKDSNENIFVGFFLSKLKAWGQQLY